MKMSQKNELIQRTTSYSVINNTGHFLKKLGLPWPRLSTDELRKKAQNKTNIYLPPQEFEKGLERLVKSIREEAQPNTFGYLWLLTICFPGY